ncbi:MAG: hypothetical protein SF029_01065 [bacterium]|nr:hypothetical protein [bacterium]
MMRQHGLLSKVFALFGLCFFFGGLSPLQGQQPARDALPRITAESLSEVRLLTTEIVNNDYYNYYSEVGGLQYSPDGRFLIYPRLQQVDLLNPLTGTTTATLDTREIDHIKRMAISPDGRWLATVGDELNLNVWDISAPEGDLLPTYDLESIMSLRSRNTGLLYDEGALGFTDDGRYVYVVLRTFEVGERLYAWNVETGEPIPEENVDQIESLVKAYMQLTARFYRVLSTDGTLVAGVRRDEAETSSVRDDVLIHVYDVPPDGVISRDQPPRFVLEGHSRDIEALFFTPDSRYLISATFFNGEVLLWDVASGERVAALPAESIPTQGLRIGDRGTASYFFILFREDGQPALVDIRDQVDQLQPAIVETVAFHPNGSLIATLTQVEQNYVRIYGIPTAEIPAHQTVLARVAPSQINLREAPALDAPIMGTVAEGFVRVAGRDASGAFVYLPDFGGWVNSETTYIRLDETITVMDLPVRAE